MHGTHTPLRTWFWAAYLVATHHPGISAKQLQRQLGLSRYETAWLILQKLRRAMVAPERELAEARGRDRRVLRSVATRRASRAAASAARRRSCGAAIEVRGAGSGRLRLAVLRRRLAGQRCAASRRRRRHRGAIVHTDGLQSYSGLAKLGYDHRPPPRRSVAPGEQLLPRAHRAISNLKAWMHGTHRGVSDEHLPVYLDEFVFRHNRRGTPMAAFQTLLGLGADPPADDLPPDHPPGRLTQTEPTGYASGG